MNKKIKELINSEQKENLMLAEQLLIGQELSEDAARNKVYGFSLKYFLRLVSTLLFSKHSKGTDYDNEFFFVPSIICIDGFTMSIQIHCGSYCQSENGYRELGYTWKYAEVGFPSKEEPLIDNHPDFDGQVGSLPIDLLQEVIDKHGGINWIETLSIENLKRIYK